MIPHIGKINHPQRISKGHPAKQSNIKDQASNNKIDWGILLRPIKILPLIKLILAHNPNINQKIIHQVKQKYPIPYVVGVFVEP
jgi:hypothetical protein